MHGRARPFKLKGTAHAYDGDQAWQTYVAYHVTLDEQSTNKQTSFVVKLVIGRTNKSDLGVRKHAANTSVLHTPPVRA